MSTWVDFRALKHNVRIEQVLEHYGVHLKRVRSDYLRGRCPLPTHVSERSRESFAVDTTKNVWACHSASCRRARQGQTGGTILDLVAWLERCTLRQAALWLQSGCAGAGDGRPEQLVSKGTSEPTVRPGLRKLPFRLRLSGAHPYLDERGIDPQTAAHFGVGYYGGCGFLRDRIVFPIHNAAGELVAYAGRALPGREPRYLFPARFPKSEVVFNLHRAFGAAGHGTVVVVEGFFDCLKVHQAGYAQVVALLGARLSGAQRELLLARFQELVLMLDGDTIGRQASQALAASWQEPVPLRLATVPAGRQPDQLSTGEIQAILGGMASYMRR